MKRTVTMEQAIPAEVIVAVIDMRLKEGKIQAIKELRQCVPGVSPRAAKDFVDAFDASCQETYCAPLTARSSDPFENLGKFLRGEDL